MLIKYFISIFIPIKLSRQIIAEQNVPVKFLGFKLFGGFVTTLFLIRVL